MSWVLVLLLFTSTPTERLEQDSYATRADCQMALTQAARTNYTGGIFRCEYKEATK